MALSCLNWSTLFRKMICENVTFILLVHNDVLIKQCHDIRHNPLPPFLANSIFRKIRSFVAKENPLFRSLRINRVKSTWKLNT